MKQFDEWWVIYTSDKGGCPKNMGDRSFFSKALTIVGEHAFKAGMLAAADITEAIDLSCDEFVTLEMIAEEIRQAVNG